MTFSLIRDCRLANEAGSAIDCLVTFDALGEVPFTATPNDVEEHGRAIWAAIQAGEGGEIAPYEPRPEPPRLIAKTTIYRRATDAELALLEATVAALPLRDRLLWQDADGGTVFVADVEPFFVQAVGAARAAALLAP